jgi:hypothetical protein
MARVARMRALTSHHPGLIILPNQPSNCKSMAVRIVKVVRVVRVVRVV